MEEINIVMIESIRLDNAVLSGGVTPSPGDIWQCHNYWLSQLGGGAGVSY